ncbi:hypothetical protein [Dyella sp. C9]|uniref:hypothetical protein n=1 Tax=Dyella sp. C9 TaxID=2202154 RepID=UPI000DEFA9E2|nr:hypothetical protein [Dyella sp. C9]
MDPYHLGYRLKTIVAEIVPIEGYFFVNHLDLPEGALRSRVASYASPREAQLWMNIVLLNDFISEVCGDDWEDADAVEILEAVALAWRYQAQAKYPGANIQIEKVSDVEYGDLGLRLIGSVD